MVNMNVCYSMVRHLCKYQYFARTESFHNLPKFFVRTLLGHLWGRDIRKVRNYSKSFVRKHVALELLSLLGYLANN